MSFDQFLTVCLDVQENYLIEVVGDVLESLPSYGSEPSVEADANAKRYYMVHPSVDIEGTQSSAV